MNNSENKLNLYHGQIIELLKSYEGRNFLGKLAKNRQDLREAWLTKAEDLLLKIIDIDKNSSYVEDARQKLSDCRRNVIEN